MSDSDKLTKREFNLLGQVFAAEIADRLPAQIGKSKLVATLHERELIEPMTRILGGSGAFPLRVEGWRLTQRGHVMYCENCTGDKYETA